MQPEIPIAIKIVFIGVVLALYILLIAGVNSTLKRSGISPRGRKLRVLIASIILLGWIILLPLLTRRDILNNFTALPPGMLYVFFPPLIVVIILASTSSFTELLKFVPPHWFIAIESFRIILEIGLIVLFVQQLVPKQMTFLGYNFNIIGGLSAPVIGYLVYRKKITSRRFIIAWHVIALFLVGNVLFVALLSAPYPFRIFMGEPANVIIAYFPFVWMPGFLAPLAYSMHVFGIQQQLQLRSYPGEQLNDKWLRLLGIPVFSLFVALAFYGSDQQLHGIPFLKTYLTSVITIITPWEICRRILVWARRKFPGMQQLGKRVLVSFSLYFIISFITTSLLFLLFCTVNFWGYEIGMPEYLKNLGIVLFFIAFTGSIYEGIYYLNQWKETNSEAEELKRKNLQAQLDSLKSQVNPHFLFNSLYTLSSMIEEAPKKSVEYVNELSQVYRYLLQSNEKQLTTLSSEVEFIRSYFFLLKTRFGENLKTEINVSETQLTLFLPPLTLQMLVENAVKHNVISSSKPLTLRIFSGDDHTLIIMNNVQKKNQFIPSNKVGLSNISQRYELLKQPPVQISETSSDFTVTISLIRYS